MRPNFFSAAALAAIVAACSSSSSVSPQQACNDLGTSICNKLEACSPYGLGATYGDVTTCVTRSALSCPSAITATGSGATAANVEACAQAYASTSCADLLDKGTPSACAVQGTLPAGTPCGSDVQCSGSAGYCKFTSGSCGVCSTRSAAGGSCAASNDCQPGLTCQLGTGATGSCVTPGAQGAPCSPAQPCQASFVCLNAACSTPLAAGAACNPVTNGCNGAMGYYCSAASVCAQVQTSAAGGACGFSASGVTTCTKATCKVGTGATGTCEALANDGAACDPVNGPSCLSPASCVNGVCTIANPASCK